MRPVETLVREPMLPASDRGIARFEPMAASSEPVLALDHFFWLLRKWKWAIVLWVGVCTVLATTVSYELVPVYEATAKVAVDLRGNGNVVGTQNVAADASSAEQLFNTEVQLVQSDGVLRPVANSYQLSEVSGSSKLPAGVKPHDAAVSIKGLTVTHPSNSLLIDISYRSPDAVKAASVANAVAHSYIAHSLESRGEASSEQSEFIEKQLDQLKQKMASSQLALASYESQLGVFNPDEKTSILSSRLQQLNTEYTDAQNDRIRKEVDYLALESGQPAAAGASPQAVNLGKLEDAVHAAEQKMAAVKTVYGPNYTEYKRAENELSEVQRQYAATLAEIGQRMKVTYHEARNRENLLHAGLMESKGELDALSVKGQHYQQLKDEAQSDKLLYNELFRKVQEARINGGYPGDVIRIADEAKPQLRPVFPNHMVFGFLGMFVSMSIALICVLVADLTNRTLRDPMQTEVALGIPVIGILPRVKDFVSLARVSTSTSPSGPLAATNGRTWFTSAEFYKEQIATVLSCLMLGRRGSPLRSLLVTSAAPGEGKSSCISHMAVAHARKGYRTLLIDADLRRPSLHEYFGLECRTGLATAIIEDQDLKEVRQCISSIRNLDVIPAGRCEELPLSLVARKVEQIIAEARSEYDMVFVDAPPMLYMSEPLQIACLVDGVFLVTQAAATPQSAVMSVTTVLARLHVPVLGIVLNQVKETMSPDYQSYGAYYRKILEMPAKAV